MVKSRLLCVCSFFFLLHHDLKSFRKIVSDLVPMANKKYYNVSSGSVSYAECTIVSQYAAHRNLNPSEIWRFLWNSPSFSCLANLFWPVLVRANSLILPMISNTVLKLMDKTDVILSSLLLANSRTPYRELADKLNLSANAVHKRIMSLIDSGVIRKFTAKISLSALQTIVVILHGKSEAESVANLHVKLGTHGSIYWVTLGGGNYMIIGAYLRSMQEIEALVEYVKKEALIQNPIIGIFSSASTSLRPSSENTLHPLDRQIIYVLRNDSRMPISDVAEEVRVTAKTVRRRLSFMTKNELVEFSIEWFPDTSNDIITTMQLRLKPDANKSIVASILKRYFPNVLFCYQFINIPNELLCFVWTNTMKELKEIQQRLEREKTVASIVSNILYTGYIFDTWRDELVRPQAPPKIEER
jgi:DNA-binding Lrp family transcriptional regulator